MAALAASNIMKTVRVPVALARAPRPHAALAVPKVARKQRLGRIAPIMASGETGQPSSSQQKKRGVVELTTAAASLMPAGAAMADGINGGDAGDLMVQVGLVLGFGLLIVLTLGVGYLSITDFMEKKARDEETAQLAMKEARRRDKPRAVDTTKPKGFGDK